VYAQIHGRDGKYGCVVDANREPLSATEGDTAADGERKLRGVCAVTITGAERSMRTLGTSVPRRDLIAEVQTLPERGKLRVARDLKGARMLPRELMDVQARGEEQWRDAGGGGRLPGI